MVEEVTRYENAYPYVIGLVLRSTKSITNVVVQHREREIGTSGYTLKKLFGLWVNGFTSFSVKPLRLATMLGAINAFLGFAYALYTVIKKLINPAVPVGFSSMMSAIMFIGGMVMLMLGMIGEYIGRIYVCMNNSPQYVIKETVNEEKKAVKIILWALLILYGAMCTFLYYKQTFHVEGMPYESDLPYHIKMAVEDHWFYSLTAILYQLFFMTPFGEILTAVFLGAVTVVTVPATKWLFQEIERRYSEKESSENVLFLLAFLCNIAMPFFVRAAHYQRYIGWQSATVWHNSTYLCMKLCGILAVAVYLRLEKKYREGLKVSEWLLLAFLFALSSAVKPSFLMVFAPIMAVYLLIDLFHKVSLKKIIIFGLTVIPSLLVILWQNMVLFGQDTGNGIEIRYGYTLTLHSTHPKVTLLLSVAFPVFVLLFMLKELLKDKWYLFAWLVWGMGLLQVTFLAESGRRARDGNFQWGYAFGIFLVMVFSIVKVLQMCKAPKGIFKNKYVRVGFLTAGTGIFAYQCYCGIVFFSKLCSGITYWM